MNTAQIDAKTTTTITTKRTEVITLSPNEVMLILKDHFDRPDAIVEFECSRGEWVEEITLTTITEDRTQT